MMFRQSFTDFIFAMNTDGSGNAASYVRALDIFGPILAKHYPKQIVGGSMRRCRPMLTMNCAELKAAQWNNAL